MPSKSESRGKYPWSDWTNGEKWTIFRGPDFGISVYAMQVSLHGRARSQGLKVRSKSVLEAHRDLDGFMQTYEGLRFRFSADTDV